MKQFKHFLILLLLFFVCGIPQSFAQTKASIPLDPNVRIGKLSNGLTYYIRKNNLPEKRAFFYIAQKVGSILEEPQQRGLAHFLEHMCFNGTKHYPKDALKQYLEKIGVKFGENLNAYTSIDETVYNIDNVPVTVPGAIDSCLLILHDWSNDLTLDPVEIDKERGVIHEEWRSRNSAEQRIQEAMMPVIMQNSKYSDCMPIGSMDIVMNFKPQVLRDYYEKWYRPDLQGIVIVGDINVDEIEAKIKQTFADIPAQPNAAKREYFPVPDNKEPIVFVGKDKELTTTEAYIFFKNEAVTDSLKSSMAYLIKDYAIDMVTSMLNARLNELLQKANPPFTSANVDYNMFYVSKTKDAFIAEVGCKEGKSEIDKSLSAILREILRAKTFGFTESEYIRARADYLRGLESNYNERDKQKSASYVRKYIRNFLDKEPIPSIEQKYALLNKLAPRIPLSAINKVLPNLITDNNQVYALIAPEKQGLVLPDKQEILDITTKVKAEKLTAYVDKVSNKPLITEKPKAGNIVSETKNTEFGTTTMKLSNGATVVVKKTDFKKDEVRMCAYSKGGTSLFPSNEIINILNLNQVIDLGGLGNFSNIELQKVLAGKKASATGRVSLRSESVVGSCSPKDIKTMFQLAYLTFTAPRKDADAFASYKTRMKADLKNQELDPNTALSDTISKAFYGNNPRAKRMKENMVDKINYDKIAELYKDRFKDASDFTFYFVGNVDADSIKPLLKEYIASLPSIYRKENSKTVVTLRKGIYTNNFIRQQQTPKSDIILYFSGKEKYNLRNSLLANMLGQILDIVYTQTVREDEGSSYGVSVRGKVDYPENDASLEIYTPTAPEKREKVTKLLISGMENLIKNGPTQKDLDKVREFMLKKYAENIKENRYWMEIMVNKNSTGINADKDYEATVKSITTKDIQSFASSLYKQKNCITVSMSTPIKK